MPCCAIIICRTKSQTSSIERGGVSFHRFPKEPNVKEKWIEATGRENWFPTKSSTICSTHFSENDFIIKKSGNRYLKPEAIPRQRIVRIYTRSPQLVTEERQDSNQDAFDIDSSEPSQSKDSCSQTIVTLKSKIKEDFSLQQSRDGGILNIYTHVEIKREDPEDIDAAVPNLSFSSTSKTYFGLQDLDCQSPTTKSHIETYTQSTMDLTDMKEDPGSPMSYVSEHFDSAESPEEHSIEIQLRKKIKMLNKNKDILIRLHDEISVLEKKHKTLIADINYLQNKKPTE